MESGAVMRSRTTDNTRHLLSILRKGRRLSTEDICRALDCSRATAMRIVARARDDCGARIVYNTREKRYHLDRSDDAPEEVPGLWLTPRELVAWGTLAGLIEQIEPGLMRDTLRDARTRIDAAMEERIGKRGTATALRQRTKILPMRKRRVNEAVFCAVTEALAQSLTVRVTYQSTDRRPELRLLSPQTLCYYRDNWYLDAFCHRDNALRTFSLDSLSDPHVTNQPAKRFSRSRLKRVFADSYGIFAGRPTHLAVIRFNGIAARYIARETWHPKQKLVRLPNGACELRIPYGDPRELLGDIMRWGELAEVLGPPELRQDVANRLSLAAKKYLM